MNLSQSNGVRARMIAHVGQYLSQIECESAQKGFTVTISTETDSISIVCDGLSLPTAQPAWSPAVQGGHAAGRWLCPLGEQILAVMPPDGSWITTAQIVKSLGEESSDLRVLLRIMSDRDILESGTGTNRGFRLVIRAVKIPCD